MRRACRIRGNVMFRIRTAAFTATTGALFAVLLPALLLQTGCATPEPVFGELSGLPGPVNPEKNVILRLALEFMQMNHASDRFDPESAVVVFRNWEAHYVAVRLYPWIELEPRTSIIKVYAMDGWAEWSSQAAVDRLKTGGH